MARGLADGREHPAVVGLASWVARELTATIADPAMRVAGFQLYTFNEVARTERWRCSTLAVIAQAGGAPARRPRPALVSVGPR